MNTRNINFAKKTFEIAAFEINSYSLEVLHYGHAGSRELHKGHDVSSHSAK